MAKQIVTVGPRHPFLGRTVASAVRPGFRAFARLFGFYGSSSRLADQRRKAIASKLSEGRTVYVLGIAPSSHNTGVSLVSASARDGLQIVCNNEEERFSGIKHDGNYPHLSLAQLEPFLRDHALRFNDIDAIVSTWDYSETLVTGLRCAFDEFPRGLALLSASASPKFNFSHSLQAFRTPALLAKHSGAKAPVPLIGLRHHDNHAAFAYAASPFAHSTEPVMVGVLDGFGDDASISLYVGTSGRLRLLRQNVGFFDSLGILYGIVSSTQGGWTTLSSEGRFMGAAAWGNGSRLTNHYYRSLREILHLSSDGRLAINRTMAGWPERGESNPYQPALEEILGPPIPADRLWNPDAVLDIDDVRHADVTRDRIDKAAALQMVFEDGLFHIVDHLIRTTGSNKLVLTGGTALNAVANMRLMQEFGCAYYDRLLGASNTCLHLWVPPAPGDAGVTIGAAYNFAMSGTAFPGEPLRHAFHCGPEISDSEIQRALAADTEIGFSEVRFDAATLADFMAFAVSRDGVVGLFQGRAETGPRALGHRSILANPCNPKTLEVLNERVKRRERIRPLAPMATVQAAQRFFRLEDGGSDDDYAAYSWMVITCHANEEARRVIPAVVHHDGTSRVQIVRRETDPLCYEYLRAMGRRVGAEVSVNTSLNVGAPIAQTPNQALQALKRAHGMDALILVGQEGRAFIAWHAIEEAPKDGGRRLRAWLEEWKRAAHL